GTQQVELVQGGVWTRDRRTEQPLQEGAQRLHARLREPRRAIVQPQMQLLARGHNQSQGVVPRVAADDSHHPQLRRGPTDRGAVQRVVLKSHESVEQGATARRLLDIAQTDILVWQHACLAVLNGGEQGLQRVVRPQLYANRYCVDKQADHLFDARQLRR